jgi:SAM-dependent methyltransferase
LGNEADRNPLTFSAVDVETIIRSELVGHWDDNQLREDDQRFSAYVRGDALRVSHILSLLPKENPFRVLEIGIGYGYVVAPLARFFPRATISAIEAPGRAYLELESFRSMLVAARTTLTACDITNNPLPFADATFDFIIFSEIIEHIPPQAIPGILVEIRRTLRPQGQLIVTTPNAVRLRNRLRFLVGKNIFESPAKQIGGTFGHLREYTSTELVDMMASAHFRNVETVPMNIPYPIVETMGERLVSQIGRWLARVSPAFQDAVCIRALR